MIPYVASLPTRTERTARALLARCTGFTDRMDRLDDVEIRVGQVQKGQTILPNLIVLDSASRTDTTVLAHEMLHVLIGRPGHPTVFAQCGLLRPGENP